MSFDAEILERNNGVRLAAVFDLAAGLMRGDPAEMKLGYNAANALHAACDTFKVTQDEVKELAEAFAFAVTGQPLKIGDSRDG